MHRTSFSQRMVLKCLQAAFFLSITISNALMHTLHTDKMYKRQRFILLAHSFAHSPLQMQYITFYWAEQISWQVNFDLRPHDFHNKLISFSLICRNAYLRCEISQLTPNRFLIFFHFAEMFDRCCLLKKKNTQINEL